MTQSTTLNIGSRRELFVDDHLIEHMSNASLRLHEPTPQEVALTTDRPWEGSMCGFITAFQDEDRFRMYYKTWDVALKGSKGDEGSGLRDTVPLQVGYAESNDGINWERPSLGLVEYNGSTDNNVVVTGAGPEKKGCHGFAPFKDPNPDCADNQRYKAVGAERYATKGDLWALTSPDGIHWELAQDEPILKNGRHGTFDSQNLVFWDDEGKEYRIYFRDIYQSTEGKGKRRGVKTATSPDFINWSEPEWLDFPNAPDEELYTNQVMPCPGAPHILIGFPTRYIERPWSPSIEALPETEHRSLRANANQRFGSALTDGLFMSSRDGKTFQRWGEAFLRPGPQLQGNWAYGDNYQSWGLIKTPSSLEGAPPEYSFFATENFWRDKGTVFRRYSIRQDGFVSVNASLQGGEFVTKPLTFTGNALSINFATSAAGSVRVEIQNPDGSAISGFSLDECHEQIGDELDRRVTWEKTSDLGELKNTPVRLRFVLEDADIFALQFQ